MRVISLVKPLKCFLFLAQPGIDERNLVSSHAIFLHVLLQLRDGLSGRGHLDLRAHRRCPNDPGNPPRSRLQKFADRFSVPALFSVDIAHEKAPIRGIDVEGADSQDQRKCLVVLVGEVIDEPLGVERVPGNGIEVDAPLYFSKSLGQPAGPHQVKRVLLMDGCGIRIEFKSAVKFRLSGCPIPVQSHRGIGEFCMAFGQRVVQFDGPGRLSPLPGKCVLVSHAARFAHPAVTIRQCRMRLRIVRILVDRFLEIIDGNLAIVGIQLQNAAQVQVLGLRGRWAGYARGAPAPAASR